MVGKRTWGCLRRRCAALLTAGFGAVLALFLAACSGSGATDDGAGGSGSGAGGSAGALGGTSGASGASGTAGGGTAGSNATGGSAGAPMTDAPLILSFSATPATLPDGGGTTTLSFRVQNADSLSIDEGVGAVSGDSVDVPVTATTIFTLTATNANGSATSSTAVVTGQNPSRDGGRYVAMISPTGGESFIAPATLRLVASGYDPNVYTNEPVDGRGTNASKVQFFVDDELVLEVDGTVAEYNVFKGFADGVAAGEHRVWCRGVYVDPDLVLDSTPMLITVAEPPAYGRTVDLDADVVVSDAMSYELVGSADERIRLNGNGHRITGDSGSLTLRYVDVFDLGNPDDTAEPGLDVTITGDLVLEDSTFDTSSTLHASFEGSATASILRNTSRSNMRMPIGQFPDSFNPDGASYPSWSFSGSSSGDKVFAGNNVGAGWVEFVNAGGWLVGGDTDADSNVLIGPRVGIYVSDSDAVEVRRNYSHHVYYGGWSQGANFELQGSPEITVEHNVVYGSSWPVRGAACEFRYNLVLEAGHQWLWAADNGQIHHNVFVGGENDVGGVYVLYEPPNVHVYSNTFDFLGGGATAVRLANGDLTLSSNAFVGAPEPTVTIEGGTLTADYNAFFPGGESYSDMRMPAHDVNGGDPAFADPPTETFDLDEAAIWRRETTAAEVLGVYRGRYTPNAGSPLIDSGDPTLGAGVDIGAVGAGTQDPADRFGQP